MTAAEDDPPAKRRRFLSDEDAALWDHVARTVRRERVKVRVTEVEVQPAAKRTPSGLAQASWDEPHGQRKLRPVVAPDVVVPEPRRILPVAPAQPMKPAPLQPVVLERRKARRIARGTEEIEARLDLHGMTQDEAHAALSRFIHRCCGSGLRMVLIITGKGAPQGSSGDVGYDDRPRGVLRRNVPRWLSEPDLRPLVVSYTTAHVRHGGDGAIYLRLRRS